MTTSQTRFFDEMAKLMTNAAGAAQGVRREVDTLIQSQLERLLNNMELVKREEFEAVKAMAQKAREENDALASRLAALELKLGMAAESASDTRAD
ncbi:accessory factor UbiK family protein [Aestuariivirga sp.]|uniref:accessory factor UbiK family protein n=1 Tax=Aestuariivirga sp. TaxID=2650926 RepID=UPI0035942CB8